MPKKAQAFYNVSEAINLDTKGLHQVAFGKYLECLQLLSNLLVEQFCSVGYDVLLESNKKEAKQLLSVVSDCAERAHVILTGDDGANKDLKKKVDRPVYETGRPTFSFSSEPDSLSSSSSDVESSQLHHVPQFTRHSVFEKVEAENRKIFKKFQTQILNAKDKYSRANLQLELQRRLAENMVIARAKHGELLKEQQAERRRVFEIATKNMLKNGPCLNENDQEKRDLYLLVLQYEANHSQHLNVKYEQTQAYPSEVTERVFQRTLQLEDHPLTQWLVMKQIKIKEKITIIVREYSCFSDWLPENNPRFPEVTPVTLSEIIYRKPGDKQQTQSIQEKIDSCGQEIQHCIETTLQIFCNVYKNELPPEADTFCYKLAESAVLSQLWHLFVTACRFANINVERRIAYTIHSCRDSDPDEFGVSPGIITKESKSFKQAVLQLKRITQCISMMDKLNILVEVSRKLCEPEDESGDSHKMGADDLVPILSYVLIHASMPQLLSECHALELLVDPKYMLGEEGYALTTFQASLNYLELKRLINPTDLDSSTEKSSEEAE